MRSTIPETLPSLTALRGICAVIIMVLHLMIGFAPHQAEQFARFRPYLTVDLFFMMSGLVMAHVYGASLVKDRRKVTGSFLWARVARIYPLHFVTLSAVVLILAIYPYPGHEFDFSAKTLLLQFSMLQGLTSKLSWNHPAWSISDEMLAYVLFIFTARPLLTGRFAYPIAVGCALALAVVAWRHNGVLLPAGMPGIVRALAGFSIGALAYRAWRTDREKLRRLFAWMLLPGVLLAFGLRNETLAVLDLAMIMILSLEVKGRFAAMLNRGPLEWLGDWSLSIYLWHIPIFFLVAGWCHAHGINPLSFSAEGTIALISSLAITTILLAALSYHGIENPARRMLRASRVSRWPAVAVLARLARRLLPARPEFEPSPASGTLK